MSRYEQEIEQLIEDIQRQEHTLAYEHIEPSNWHPDYEYLSNYLMKELQNNIKRLQDIQVELKAEQDYISHLIDKISHHLLRSQMGKVAKEIAWFPQRIPQSEMRPDFVDWSSPSSSQINRFQWTEPSFVNTTLYDTIQPVDAKAKSKSKKKSKK